MAEKATVSYGRTINLGNYNSERIDITLTIEEGQDPKDAMSAASDVVKAEAKKNLKSKTDGNKDLPF